jgi:serine/threonine protein kinase
MTEGYQDEGEETSLRQLQSAFDNSGSLAPGTILIDRFILEAHIGSGGMGHVYRARDLHMQGEPAVAVKILSDELRTNSDAIAALQRECRKARMLAHDAIVRVFEFHTDGFHNFITMELLEGESVDAAIKRHPNGLEIDRALAVLAASGSALTYAHQQEPPFIHSDFKPSNLFLTKNGRTKVLDFGVARAAQSAHGQGNPATLFDPRRLGALTPAYASCEMLAALDPDPRDDVYAFACVAYVLFTGAHPFGSRPADQARSLGLAPPNIPHLSKAQNQAIARGLAFDRQERTPTIDEFLAELSHRDRRKARSTVPRAAAGVAVAVFLIAVAAFSVVTVSRNRERAAAAPESALDDSPSALRPIEAVPVSPSPAIDLDYVQGLAGDAQRSVCDRLEKDWATFSCEARRACYRLRAGWDSELATSLASANPAMAQLLTYKATLNDRIGASACEEMAAARDRARAEMESRFPSD